jgi:shikimate dehydrogenase
MLQANASIRNQDSKLLTGLIGENILASRSPWLHEQEAVAQGLQLTYVLFDFAARGWTPADLPRVLDATQTLGFSGVNVTHPFKQGVIPLLDELAPSARKVGAVNTVQFSGGKRIGHNTDVTGFAENVRTGLPGAKLDRVIQFGAGGGGSATAHALLGLGVRELVLIDSDVNRRSSLAAQLKSEFPDSDIRDADVGSALVASADGVVNATPVGMVAYPGTPFDTALLAPSQWVADIVYFPLETRLLAQARAKGCATLSGSGMAVFQAADAFDIFTGRIADRNRMLKSFDAFRDVQTDCAA